MSRILFVPVMPTRLSYCFNPSKERMETTCFVRKRTLDYQELESNPNFGGVSSKLGSFITKCVWANGALIVLVTMNSLKERLRRG